MSTITRPNIILFGASGSGKSSIVNMLSMNDQVADTSSGAHGCTFRSRSYDTTVLGRPVTLWDTAGLDEGDAGVPSADAIAQLYKLVRGLTDGVNLLMFVMRAPRIKGSVPKNWKLIHEIICQRRVPIVIVITGLEEEENMDNWWFDNKGSFEKYGILPAGFACITASRGRPRNTGGYMYDDEYEKSREKVQELIHSTSLYTPWVVPPAEWFKTIVKTINSSETVFWFFKKQVAREEKQEVGGDALGKLVSICGMSENEARVLAEKMKDT